MATLTAKPSVPPTSVDSPSNGAGAHQSSASNKFVPIRPAFRPLLPKPSAAASNEPTVVIKSQVRNCKITKKRKSDSGLLPSTISPSSLVAPKRRRSPPAVQPLEKAPVAAAASRGRRSRSSSNNSIAVSVASSEEDVPVGSVSPKDLSTSPESLSAGSPFSGSTISSEASIPSMSALNMRDESVGSNPTISAASIVSVVGPSSGLAPATLDRAHYGDLIDKKPSTVLSVGDQMPEPLPDFGSDIWPGATLDAANEALDVLETLPIDDLCADSFLAPADDDSTFDPMEFFGPRVDIF